MRAWSSTFQRSFLLPPRRHINSLPLTQQLVDLTSHSSPPKEHSWQQICRLLAHHYRPTPQTRIQDPPPPSRDRHLPIPPSTWNAKSFAEHIFALASYQPPRPDMARLLAQSSSPSREDVAELIQQLLNTDHLRHCLTEDVCNIALLAFLRSSSLHRLQPLLARMAHLRFSVTIDSWNAMLETCARSHDVIRFCSLLRNMIAAGGRPNEQTWALFLTAVDDVKVKRVIFGLVAESGVLRDPGASAEVAGEFARHDLAEIWRKGPWPVDIPAFLRQMQEKYGPRCLENGLVGNRMLAMMLDGRGSLKTRIISSLGLLGDLKIAGSPPDDSRLRLFLRRVNLSDRRPISAGKDWRKDDHLDLMILDNFESLGYRRPGLLAHQLLFGLARRRRRLNMLRTVWVSACLEGYVTSHMQSFLTRSMLSRVDRSRKAWDSTHPMAFHDIAAKFVVSVPPQVQRRTSASRPDQMWQACSIAVMSDMATVDSGILSGGLIPTLRQAAGADGVLERANLWGKRFDEERLMQSRMAMRVSFSSGR